MTRANIVVLSILSILLGGCTQRMICPAYQSAYIYDKDELRKKFSYFLGDSTPKVYTASKTRYLVAEPMSYQKRVRNLQTVKMKPVPVMVPDSLINKDSVTMEELDKAARSVIDSTVVVDVPKKDSTVAPLDSIYVITKDKEVRVLKYNGADSLDYDSISQRYVVQRPKYYVADVRYNLEQDSYLWYLRDVLVLPDARIAKMGKSDEGEGGEGEKGERKKQGLKGFFKNLFKKKPKEEADTTELETGPKEEFDFIDEADSISKAEVPLPGQEDTAAPVKENKKATKASRKKNKKKPVVEPKPEEKKPADKKKEEEDDGF